MTCETKLVCIAEVLKHTTLKSVFNYESVLCRTSFHYTSPAHLDSVVHVEPLWMMVFFVGEERNSCHEPESLIEILKSSWRSIYHAQVGKLQLGPDKTNNRIVFRCAVAFL